MVDLYGKKNGRIVSVLYPVHGSKNILRRVRGVKLRSYTGPRGRGITVQEIGGNIRSLSVSKCVADM